MTKFAIVAAAMLALAGPARAADCRDSSIPFTPAELAANPLLISAWADKCAAERSRDERAELNAELRAIADRLQDVANAISQIRR